MLKEKEKIRQAWVESLWKVERGKLIEEEKYDQRLMNTPGTLGSKGN